MARGWDGPRLVVFDLAGTTVEDRGQVPAAFVAALAQHGIEVRAGQVAAVRGASKRQAILELLPDGPERALRADALYAAFRVELARRYERDGVRPVPGAEAGHAAGVRWNVGVLSGAHDERTLCQAPHTHVVPSVAELPRLWSD